MSRNNTTTTITVHILLFASARDAAGGVSQLTFQLDPPYATTRTVRERLALQFPGLQSLVLDEESITLAVNEEYVEGNVPLKDGDTVALIPPISGG